MNKDPISELTALWYETIGSLHHKDRDCHFSIIKRWKYDGQIKYEVEHHGYILGELNVSFNSYDAAESYLVLFLHLGILKWIDCDDNLNYITKERRREIILEANQII